MSRVKYPDSVAATITSIANSEFGTLAEGAVIDLSNMVNLESVGNQIASGTSYGTIIFPEGLEELPAAAFSGVKYCSIVIPSTVTSAADKKYSAYSGITSITLRFGELIEASENAEELTAVAESAIDELDKEAVQSYDFGGVSTVGNLSAMYAMTTVTMDFEGEANEAPEVYYLAGVDSELVQMDESLLAYDEDISAWRLSVAGADDGYATGLYVSAVDKPSVADATIELSATSAAYTGSVFEPGVTVTYDGTVLEEGTDYTLEYADNVEVGTATVTVTGTGDYAGTATVAFEVTAAEIVSAELSQTSYDYDGTAKFPSATVVDTAGATLVEGTDYELLYSAGCTDPGTYKVTIVGLGTYTQTLTASFTIVEAEVAVDTESADYQAGYAAGQTAAAESVDETSESYQAGYAAGQTAAAESVDETSESYQAGYAAGQTAASSTATVKATQELGVAVATKSVKVKKLKAKKRTVKALTVTGAKGKVTYAKVAKGSSKKLTVNSKTGKITVKKGTKKGTYKIKVRVKAASTSKYAAASTVITVKVKVVK